MRPLPTLALVTLLAISPVARAQTDDPLGAALATEARERAQAERIAAAVVAGRITSAEARTLERMLTRLRAYQLTAYRDDVITARERARLDRMHRRIDEAIARFSER